MSCYPIQPNHVLKIDPNFNQLFFLYIYIIWYLWELKYLDVTLNNQNGEINLKLSAKNMCYFTQNKLS